ncbi:unnamed protein product [Caenorhabditis auriculariae]|uniref:Uncharacterized protein n=1 Tax=Caenorhabditis auriculariae TaxID=2777116 RepID=A0A8S1HUE4_9PELO|nr:unnamed protein product [Caenorhabditis auriculariae]
MEPEAYERLLFLLSSVNSAISLAVVVLIALLLFYLRSANVYLHKTSDALRDTAKVTRASKMRVVEYAAMAALQSGTPVDQFVGEFNLLREKPRCGVARMFGRDMVTSKFIKI